MAWNQPPIKEVNPACAKDINFVKPSHSDLLAEDAEKTRSYKRHDFNPRQPAHRVLDIDSVTSLLQDIKESMPSTGLKHFWESNTIQCQPIQQPKEFTISHHFTISPFLTISNSFSPWNYVIFSHENYADFQKEFADMPTSEQCYDYMKSMALSKEVVDRIEETTREQTDSKLWKTDQFSIW